MDNPVWWDAFIARIDRLQVLIPQAVREGERKEHIRPSSLENAKAFAATLHHATKPAAFIQDDGLARLVWQTGKIEGVRMFGEQVAIKFRETDLVDFIFFRLEREDLGRTDIMGITHADAVLDLVSVLGLDHVMTGN